MQTAKTVANNIINERRTQTSENFRKQEKKPGKKQINA